MKGSRKKLFIVVAVLIVVAAVVTTVVVLRNSSKKTSDTTKQPSNTHTAFNEAKVFDEIDKQATAGKCADTITELTALTKTDDELQKALAQVRLGECQIRLGKAEESLKYLQPAAKTLNDLKYQAGIIRVSMDLQRAKDEIQIKKERSRELKPNPPPAGPVL